eukprot:scaffold138268_cov24-Attheya_sp.AAC.1
MKYYFQFLLLCGLHGTHFITLCAENLEVHSGMTRMWTIRNIGPKSTNIIPSIERRQPLNIDH